MGCAGCRGARAPTQRASRTDSGSITHQLRGHLAPTPGASGTYSGGIRHLLRGHHAPTPRASRTDPDGISHRPRWHHAPPQRTSRTAPESVSHQPRRRLAPTPGVARTKPRGVADLPRRYFAPAQGGSCAATCRRYRWLYPAELLRRAKTSERNTISRVHVADVRQRLWWRHSAPVHVEEPTGAAAHGREVIPAVKVGCRVTGAGQGAGGVRMGTKR
jgi:hypothetical protein